MSKDEFVNKYLKNQNEVKMKKEKERTQIIKDYDCYKYHSRNKGKPDTFRRRTSPGLH